MINILLSRPYLKESAMNVLAFFAKGIQMRILIDCGAYTDYMAGREAIPIQEYIRWLQGMIPRWEELGQLYGYLSLDVIGDADKTMDNYEAMLDAGLRPIPIMTRGITDDHIARMVETAPYIALGGIFGASVKERSALRWMIDQLPDKYPVHWLSFGAESFVRYYRPASFDLSSWMGSVRWGRIHHYKGNLTFGPDITRGKEFTPEQTRSIRALGFDPGRFADQDSWRLRRHSCLSQCVNNGMYLSYMDDLDRIDVKMFLAVSCTDITRYLFSLLQSYAQDGTECIGLSPLRIQNRIFGELDRPQDITQEFAGVACRHR